MNIGIYQSAASLSALERWQDVVAQNITSSQMTGYRQRTVEFSGQHSGNWNLNAAAHGSSTDGISAMFTKPINGINFSAGEQQPTRRELDVAIQGEGFFTARRPDGSMIYTRSGEFHQRPDRTLAIAGDNEVMSDAGSPIVLLPSGGPVTIDSTGMIYQNATPLGRLAINKFAHPEALRPISGGVFTAGEEAGMQPVDRPTVTQGYLEQSNVKPLREMVDLVLISRAYEANEKVISTVDKQFEKTLQALG